MAPSDIHVALGPLGIFDYQKLRINASGELITRATGEFTMSGLRTAMRTTTMDVSDVTVAIPAIPLLERNAISINNLSTTDKLYIGNTDVTADTVNGTTSGWEIGPGENMNLDITEEIVIYGRAETGKSVKLKVFEIA